MPGFKIAAAQGVSVRGDIPRNITTHSTAIATAAMQGVSVLVFPELSLTGYEPDLAAELAMTPSDSRLTPLLMLERVPRDSSAKLGGLLEWRHPGGMSCKRIRKSFVVRC
jgi:predicted amidohydrolase